LIRYNVAGGFRGFHVDPRQRTCLSQTACAGKQSDIGISLRDIQSDAAHFVEHLLVLAAETVNLHLL
jgi:hypothetical protein